ncbi:MAG: hypothetical protein AAB400_01955 [Patescibacteria group bacterium]
MKKVIVGIIVIIIVGSGSFYGGMTYAKKNPQQRPSGVNTRLQNAGQNGVLGGMRGNGAGGFVNGEILSKDDKSIIVKLRNGGSKIVFMSAATKVTKSVEGSFADITIGEQVMVSGEDNSDGSMTAQSIQIRPDQATFQQRQRQ